MCSYVPIYFEMLYTGGVVVSVEFHDYISHGVISLELHLNYLYNLSLMGIRVISFEIFNFIRAQLTVTIAKTVVMSLDGNR